MSADEFSGWVDKGTSPDAAAPGSEHTDTCVTVTDTTASSEPVVPAVRAIAWIEQDGVSGNLADFNASGFGRVMLTRFTVVNDRHGVGIGLVGEGSNVVRLTAAGADQFTPGALVSANDNVVWVGDEGGTGFGGVFGRDPQAIATIHGETIVTWIDQNGSLNGKSYPADPGDDADGAFAAATAQSPSAFLTELLNDIALLAPGQRYKLVETGRDGFAILWAATLAGAIVLNGRQFSAPDQADGSWTVSETRTVPLATGFEPTTDFQVLGWSAEDGVATISYAVDGETDLCVQTVALETTAAAWNAGAGDEGARVNTSSSDLSLQAVPEQPATAEAGDLGDGASPSEAAFVSLHAGIVDVAGSGGRVMIGDAFTEQDGIAGFSAGDAVEVRDDDLTGTQGDDIIFGDLPDLSASGGGAIAGGNDRISGGDGNDVIYGGGGDDTIDGGGNSAGKRWIDTAIFTGDSRDYSITANGDGTFTIVLAKSDAGWSIDRHTNGFEGVDVTRDIEQYQFLNGDLDYLTKIVNGAEIATLDTSGHGVILESDLYRIPERDTDGGSGSYDGTATAWGLSRDADGNVDNDIDVFTASSSGGDANGTVGSAVVSALSDGGFAIGYVDDGHVHVSSFDVLGRQAGTATSGATIDTTVSPVMDAAGDGVAIAYVTSGTGDAIGVELFDADHSSGSIAASGHVSDLAVSGTDDGHHVDVAWVESGDEAEEATGDIVVQRLEVVAGDETKLVAAGLDGEAGEGSDSAEAIGAGRAPAITETSDDGFAVAWVGENDTSAESAEQIEGRVFDAAGLVVETFKFAVGDKRHIRDGSGPTLQTTGDGDLFVAWQEVDDDAGGLAIMSALVRQLGPSEWANPIIRQLRKFDDEPREISIAVAGANGDAIIVTWRSEGEGGGDIVGQRYSVDAIAAGAADIAVGLVFDVATSESNEGKDRDEVNVAGLDDGRVVVVSREIDRDQDGDGASASITVQATLLDTRNSSEVLISEDQGVAQDTLVGTIDDDIVDGRASGDNLYGALGNDVLTGGTGSDHLDGGEGDDTLLGGSGTDYLDGGDGDDLLMGGFGRDYIRGGDGDDTLSYRGETRSVTVDLAEGLVRSDAAHNAVNTPSQNLDVRGISRATLYDANVEDILGSLETTNRGSDGGVEFHSGHGIENVEGGLGSDNLLGDNANNILTGGKGNDLLDGRGGHDTATFTGNAADYDVKVLADGSVTVAHARNTSSAVNDGIDTLRQIEAVRFADGAFELHSDGTLSPAGIAAAFGIVSEISVAAIECFDFDDLDALDVDSHESGSSGSSGSSDLADLSTADLYGLGSDTLYFGDLDALCPSLEGRGDYDDLFDTDGLDYGSCTVFASSAEIEAAMCLDGPDALDALTVIETYQSKSDICDPTEFRVV